MSSVPTRPRKKKSRPHADDLRGASRLVIDATKHVTDVVEGMHVTIASGPAILGSPLQVPARAITGLVYGSIRGVTRVVGATIDTVLAKLAPLLGKSAPGAERAAVVAALNGVIGDYLRETENPLATEMQLCRGGEPLEIERGALRAALPEDGRKLVVLVHGICMNDVQWNRGGHDHGAALARDLGYTPVYLRYNSGLHISTNGRHFADLLERLVAAWYAPIDELVLLGHSMGGLVSRSACHIGEEAGHTWRAKLTRLVCIASPHDGAPLERVGNLVEPILGASRYSAPLARLGRLRSAGVTDLRHGNVLDEDWGGRDRFALGGDPRTGSGLPTGARCYAIAGSLSRGPRKNPLGDGIVPVDSALGRSPRSVDRALAFPEEHQWIGYGVGHLQVLSRPAVYERLRSWLAE